MGSAEAAMAGIHEWLDGFARCVRQCDFESGRAFFHRDVYCFGSRAAVCTSLDELVQQQWRQIWPNITDFRFEAGALHCQLSEDARLACLMVPWVSTGYHRDGTLFPRRGRVTIVLTRSSANERWRARHTHYSLYPGTPEDTRRPGP